MESTVQILLMKGRKICFYLNRALLNMRIGIYLPKGQFGHSCQHGIFCCLCHIILPLLVSIGMDYPIVLLVAYNVLASLVWGLYREEGHDKTCLVNRMVTLP